MKTWHVQQHISFILISIIQRDSKHTGGLVICHKNSDTGRFTDSEPWMYCTYFIFWDTSGWEHSLFLINIKETFCMFQQWISAGLLDVYRQQHTICIFLMQKPITLVLNKFSTGVNSIHLELEYKSKRDCEYITLVSGYKKSHYVLFTMSLITAKCHLLSLYMDHHDNL